MTVFDLHLNPFGNQVVIIPREIEVTDKMFLVAQPNMRFRVKCFEDYQDYLQMNEEIGVRELTAKMEGTPYILKFCSFHQTEDGNGKILDGPAIIMKNDENDPLLTEQEMEDARREYLKRLEVKEIAPGTDILQVIYRIKEEEMEDEQNDTKSLCDSSMES